MGRALLLFSEFVTKRVNEKGSEQCLSISITRVTVLVSNTGKPLRQTLCTIVHELFHISLVVVSPQNDFQELTSKMEFCWQKSALKWTPLTTLLKHICPCGIYTCNTPSSPYFHPHLFLTIGITPDSIGGSVFQKPKLEIHCEGIKDCLPSC